MVVNDTNHLESMPVGIEITVTIPAGEIRYLRTESGWTSSYDAHAAGVVGTAIVRPGAMLKSDAFSTVFETGSVVVTDNFSTIVA